MQTTPSRYVHTAQARLQQGYIKHVRRIFASSIDRTGTERLSSVCLTDVSAFYGGYIVVMKIVGTTGTKNNVNQHRENSFNWCWPSDGEFATNFFFSYDKIFFFIVVKIFLPFYKNIFFPFIKYFVFSIKNIFSYKTKYFFYLTFKQKYFPSL